MSLTVNCAVLSLPFIKNIGTLCLFLLMCHLFVDRGRAVDVCLFELELLGAESGADAG